MLHHDHPKKFQDQIWLLQLTRKCHAFMESWVHLDVEDPDFPERETTAVQDTEQLEGMCATCHPRIDCDVDSCASSSEDLATVDSGLDLADSEPVRGPVKTIHLPEKLLDLSLDGRVVSDYSDFTQSSGLAH